MLTVAGLFGHLTAAAGFGGLSLWLLYRHGDSISGLWLVAASFATAIWALLISAAAFYGGNVLSAIRLFETLRNVAWTGFLVSVLRTNQSGEAQAERERHAVFSILGGVLVVQLVVDALPTPDMTLSSLDSVGSLPVILRIVPAGTILLLIHNLFLRAPPAHPFGERKGAAGG